MKRASDAHAALQEFEASGLSAVEESGRNSDSIPDKDGMGAGVDQLSHCNCTV